MRETHADPLFPGFLRHSFQRGWFLGSSVIKNVGWRLSACFWLPVPEARSVRAHALSTYGRCG